MRLSYWTLNTNYRHGYYGKSIASRVKSQREHFVSSSNQITQFLIPVQVDASQYHSAQWIPAHHHPYCIYLVAIGRGSAQVY